MSGWAGGEKQEREREREREAEAEAEVEMEKRTDRIDEAVVPAVDAMEHVLQNNSNPWVASV